MSSDIARRQTIGKWLKLSCEWRIPVYQRHYAWESDKEFSPTRLFWEVVEERAKARLEGKDVDPYYFGAILVEKKGESVGEPQKLDVVDGQQRLTTITVAMFAIISVARKFNCKEKIQTELSEYIFNIPKSRELPKLVPTNFDCTQFNNLLFSAFDLSQPKQPDHDENTKKSKIVQARDFFKEQFEEFVKENEVYGATKTINALIYIIVYTFELILIELKKTDKSQKVFETLNSTAKQLTTFDLIRNDIFYRAANDEPESDVKLFNDDLWQEFERPFWEEHPGRSNKNTHIEAYIARMLMAKNQQYLLMDRNSIFKEYKNFAERIRSSGKDVPEEIEIISEYVDVYKYLVGESDNNPIGSGFDFGYFMYKICKSMDFYPALFTIVCCEAPTDDKQQMIRLLESYVIRRHICKLTADNYNQFAPGIFHASGKKPNYRALHGFLMDFENETHVFPDNKALESACLRENFYARNNLKDYIFDCIVAHEAKISRDEKCDTKGLTIDHIMPIAWRARDGWKSALADFNEWDIDVRIHTIGNLTPMSRGRNAAKSNHDWSGEKGARALLADCDLKFTRKLAEKESWGLNDIRARSEELAAIICEIWPEDIPAKER